MLEKSGKSQEAISYWKTAYESLSSPYGRNID
jgi:hypothetical protein